MYDKKYNLLHLNPGACGIHGFHQVKTVLRFAIDGTEIKNMEIIELGKRAWFLDLFKVTKSSLLLNKR